MEHETSFASLLIVSLLAFVVPLLTTQLRRIRLPVVVGEIIAGIIVGRSGLNIVSEDPWLSMLATLGFAYLMFLSGLEVDFDMVAVQANQIRGSWRQLLRSPVTLGFVSFGITVAAGTAFAFFLRAQGWIQDPILMGLILSTTSLGLVVPTLKERRELRTMYGQALLFASLIADFATMLLISIYVIFHTSGLTLEMLVVLILVGAFFAVYRVLMALQRHPPLERWFQRVSEAVGHLETRGAFAIGLAFIALAEWLGIEVILGAFLGGALLSLISREDESELRERLDAMGYGFFIPFFFIMVGVDFELRQLLASPELLALLALLVVVAYGIKIAAALVFRLAFDWRRTFGAGFLLSSRLSLIIAAAAIGVEMNAISPAVNANIILLAIITCTLSPVLFNRIVPTPVTEEEPSEIIVAGNDVEAVLLAQRLARHGSPVVLAFAGQAPDLGQMRDSVRIVTFSEPTVAAVQAWQIRRASAMVALLNNDRDNLRLCQAVRAALDVSRIVARVTEPANAEAYTAVGASPVTAVNSEVTVLENLVHHPNLFALLSASNGQQEIFEMEVRNPFLDGVPIHALRLPGDALVMVIRRGDRFIVPRGDTRLALGDLVSLLAAPDEEADLRELFTG